jgi:hypothetical protein
MATLEGAETSLQLAAQAALLREFKVRPANCSNGLPKVTCLWDVCKKGACASNQLCVPHNCGKCEAR